MATDATGVATSPDSIPTYNTSVDAPSGLGFNAAMAAIQTALSARISKPASIVSGEVPVWNGAGWDRSSVTRVGTTSIGTGVPATGKYVDGATGAWTALPSASTTYRKTTAKTVNTTVVATDLLNAEITLAAGVLGATGVLRLRAWGDFLNNTGGSVALPRFQVLLGATTMIDTNAPGVVATSATRFDWNLELRIQNATASSQTVMLSGDISSGANTIANTAFATGEGLYQEVVAGVNMFHGVNSGLAVNTALAQALILNVINGSASAAYETKLFGALVEVI